MEFEFRDNKITLEIVGKQYEIETSDELQERMIAHAKRAMEAADKVEEIEKAQGISAAVKNCCQVLTEIVDDILGSGATAEIFGDRQISFYDLLDLYGYISGEINAYFYSRQQQVKAVANHISHPAYKNNHRKRRK